MFFKNYCQDKWQTEPVPDELKKRKADIDEDFLTKKAVLLNDSIEADKKAQTDKGLGKAANMALRAVSKELMFENMQEREELLKEKNEYQNMLGQDKCVERAIDKRKNVSAAENYKAEVSKEVN